MQDLSRDFVDVIPKTMQSIRNELRGVARSEFTVPQFRVLAFISNQEVAGQAAMNNEVAEHIGVAAPAMSRMIAGLVERGFVLRETSKNDRRQVLLKLSAKGRAKLDGIQAATRTSFASRFDSLSASRKADLAKGLDILRELFL